MGRTYSETVKKWAAGIGISGVGMFVLYFIYLQAIGAITITGVSDDVVCMGSEVDPCYGYINFTANEDIFIYPVGYDPWGRNTPFVFDPAVMDWKLQRSWGSSWRNIPLDKGCTGTWCGGKSFNTVANPAVYSIAFRKGIKYQVRIVATKESPLQTVKWFSDELGVADPLWVAAVNLSIGTECLEWGEKQSDVPDNCWNVSMSRITDCPSKNSSCLINKTGGYYSVVNYSYPDCNYPMIKVCVKSEEILKYGEKNITTDSLGVGCVYEGKDICCVDPWDGDVNNPECRNGVSYAYWTQGEKVKYYGHLDKAIKTRFDKEGIKETVAK